MKFRFTLQNDNLGTQEISEPDGWKECVLKLERDPNFHSLIEYFDGKFIFYGSNGVFDGGINFIRACEQIGINEILTITIEFSFDLINYETLFIGQLDLSTINQISDNKIQCDIIRTDFWAKFISRLDTPVDIRSYTNLDGENVASYDGINLRLTSQTIRKKYSGESDNINLGTGEPNLHTYYQVDFPVEVLSEINTKYNLPMVDNTDLPVPLFEVDADSAGVYDFDIQIIDYNYDQTFDLYTIQGSTIFYIQFNDEPQIEFLSQTSQAHDGLTKPFQAFTANKWRHLQTRTMIAGDLIRIYGFKTVGGGGGGHIVQEIWCGQLTNAGVTYKSYLKITAQTVFPSTYSDAFLVHDVGAQISDRLIGQNRTFYSDFLGSALTVTRQYGASGCGWNYALTKGLQIRQYSIEEKPYFQSFNDWWNGINPILNLGLGYDTVSGNEVIRVEEKDFFYDDSSVSVYFSNVQDIKRAYDKTWLLNKVEIGYEKWQSEDISGIDDTQTKHTYSTILKRAGQAITLFSKFIAASLAIETTRRTTKTQSADYKFDNDTFIIALNPTSIDISPETSPDVTDFKPELDENFTSIDGLLNSETRYNNNITPARNFKRWAKFLQGCLQSYLTSVFKFVSGEGNYAASSNHKSDSCNSADSITENADIQVTSDYVFLPILYEITLPMEIEDYDSIRNNRNNPIGVSRTTENYASFFIKTLEYKIAQGVATISAWPITFMDISIVESTFTMEGCPPATPEAAIETFRLLESGDFRLLESGDFRLLE